MYAIRATADAGLGWVEGEQAGCGGRHPWQTPDYLLRETPWP